MKTEDQGDGRAMAGGNELVDGHRVEISGQTLPELTAELDAARERAEDAGTALVLDLRPGAAAWPGTGVGVHEVNKWERVLRRVERLDAPVVAVALGGCGGPALEALLVADHRIATPDLRIALPRSQGRFWPGMALYRLVNQFGTGWARRVVLRGLALTAENALAIGLVDEVTDAPEAALGDAVAALEEVSGQELAVRRRLLLEAATTSFEEALGTHLAACDRELLRAGLSGAPR
jgi:isomerase DpgB